LVAVRITRQAVDIITESTQPVAAGRVDAEVSTLATEASSGRVRVTRQAVEVISKFVSQAEVSRLDTEVSTLATEASNGRVLITRQAIELVARNAAVVSASRIDSEVTTLATENAGGDVRITRQAFETIARRGATSILEPLSLGDDNEIFMHDWADACILRSSYLTDSSISPSTGAESRRGLSIKPERVMEIVWRQSDQEFDEFDFTRLDRLYVFLRRMTNQRVAVPLYPDLRELNQAYLSTDDTIFIDTTIGRWFVGGRVVIVQHDYAWHYASHSFHIIADIQSDRLVFDAPLGIDVLELSQVVPMIDCEITLDVEWVQRHGCIAEVKLEVAEISGTSQLPPTKADTPTGAPTHAGIPILDLDPDWTEGVKMGRSRQGSEFRSGRARSVTVYAERSRQTHELAWVNKREEFWRLVEHFDTRRGRLRSFWHIDKEQIWNCVQVDPSFVAVEPKGDFDDFKEELEGGYVGIELLDGTKYVRDAVTVQSIATTYRISVDPVLPSGILATDVVRVARARVTRFDTDEMEERWTHAGLSASKLPLIEALEEKVVTT